MTDTASRSVIGAQLPPARTLPFAPKASGSIAGRTLGESTYAPLPAERHLGEQAPNVLVVLIDDAGPALPKPLGGVVETPTLDRIRSGGIGFNRFHTTAMCSPTRASLLTGRNHHRVGSGQIAELANDWDGYSGHIPKSSATMAEVLRNYGYSTGAWGKWHNTPAEETTSAGPYDRWPTGYGFEYFYGFLAGEASQYEPNLVRNTTGVLPPKSPEEGYHLSEDLADDAMHWLRDHKANAPDKPFYMYWATGAIHGPHHIMKEWADKYKGKFDDGWDAYRETAFAGAKESGWIPDSAELTPRPESLQGWDDIPDHQKPFQARLMEVCAGFGEHADVQAGRLIDEIERLGYLDNTIIVYIWGDNGSSGEGQNGTISELLAQNMIPTTIDQHIAALEELGGLDALGTPATDNQYHAAWAWAGSTPYQGMKLMASHLGGTRNPMFVQWPGRIAHDPEPRTQFHHVIDVVPTIYEILGISHPDMVNGIPQDPIDGTSFAYAIDDPSADGRHRVQYFEIMASRSIYSDGWIASATGPRLPWVPGAPPGIATWTPDADKWELYHLDEDWSQARDLAAEHPEKLAQLKELFAIEAAKNEVLPVGGGLWVPVYHPEFRLGPAYTEWELSGDTVRIPEFCAPALGNKPNTVSMQVDLPEQANGVLYKLGGAGGGLTAYLVDGVLHYEYNLFLVQRTIIASAEPLAAGEATIEIVTDYLEPRPGGPLSVSLKVNGAEVGSGTVPVSAPLLFSANDCLDIGRAYGGPVSRAYFDKMPFAFDGTIDSVHVAYHLPAKA
ncbi:arylsulfatase [Agromyces sp. H3Y2-19a]|jgi:arylsulfatase|uniref:arylsulfatase n=1 Tax=Agromyces TaxID=33877 RepID=UPI001E3938A6|nr:MULTISPECIES: arylsulfatase [Agromyces]MCD5348323.1 arylsulfatase [Agromyces sp. S2-1-8]MDF0514072.1 arylsulfatase [Agromyces chromiiresistens]